MVSDVPVVGMHHCGERQLLEGKKYLARAEVGHPADYYAIAILETEKPNVTRAYVMKEYARIFQPLLIAEPRILVNNLKKKLRIDLKWPEIRPKVIFGHPKWPLAAIL